MNTEITKSLHLLVCTWLLHVLALSSGQSTCASGFTSQDLNTALQSSSLTIPYEQQRIIIGISFNCSGTITSWTIGAEWRTGGLHNFFPHLQIWRSTTICGANIYNLVGDTELSVDSAGLVSQTDYVFTGNPDPVLEFQAGDILGIFQPRESRSRVRVYYDTSAGPTNYYIDTDDNQPSLTSFAIADADGSADQLPLVTVGIIELSSERTEYELLDETEVTTALHSTSLTIPYEQQRIIPGIPLNCSGTITSWTIGAEWRTGGNHNFFPHLQLWRSVDGCTYTLIGDTELTMPDSTGLMTETDYVFSGTPDPAVGFQTGDILGIYQPRESRSRVRVYYDTSTGPPNYYNDIDRADEPPLIQDFVICYADGLENGLPLLAVEITIDCEPLTNPENGIVVVTTITTDSLTATYNCNTGYELVGEVVRDCNCQDTGGLWTGIPPTCRLIDCGGLTDPEGGQITFTPGAVATIETGLDAVATYSCNASAGYMLFDVGLGSTRTCQDSGLWSGVAGICTRCDFSTLTDPGNGAVSFTTIPELTALYTCDMGYKLVGDAMLICQPDGQFSGGEPECDVIDCGGLPAPNEGQVTITPGLIPATETGLEAEARYTCNAGYNLVGDVMRTCQANSQWNGTEPNCASLCPDPAGIVNGMVTFTGNSVGDTATYTCNSGFELIGNASVTCTQVDVNSAAFSTPVCRPMCPDPSNIVNGMVTFTGNSVGDTATYTCNSDFELIGIVTLTCTQVDVNSAALSPAPPECRPMCPDPGIVNGMVTFTGNSVGNTGTYTCNSGFELIGSASATCMQVDVNSAAFSPAPPVCRLIDCGDRSDPENGQVAISSGLLAMNGFGATTTYTCNTSAGYMLVGTAMQTCQDNGQWSGVEPTCIRCNTSSISDPGNGSVAITSPGGVIIAVYTCDVGYAVVGVATRTCQSDGQFSGQEPVCQVVDCGVPPFIGNGNFNISETTFESVAEYGCDEGFTLSGSHSHTCQADGTWSGEDPVCVNTQVENLGPIVGGTVAGFLVAALVTLGIILAIILIRRRRKTATNISLELQPKVSNRASDQAALTHFQPAELDIETSGNAAYVTSADAIPASHNEAYAITSPIAITTSQNEAYGSLKPGGKDSDDYQLDNEEAGDQYDYVTR